MIARCDGADPADRGISPADLRPSPSAAQERRADQRRPKPSAAISFRSAPWETPSAHPLRQIKLINGDSLIVEVLSSPPRALDVRWLGQVRFRIPVAAIDRIVSLPGESEILNVHFDQRLSDASNRESAGRTVNGMLAVNAGSGAQRLDLPVFQGDFRFSLRFRAPQSAAKTSVSWTLQFSEQQQLHVHRDANGFWRVAESMSEISQRQAVPEKAGWHTLRLQRSAGRLFVSLDEAFLGAGLLPAAVPTASEIESSGSPVYVDQMALMGLNRPLVDLPAKYATDAVVGAGGETWWGDVQSLGSDDVVWVDGSQTWRRSWNELRGVLRGEAPSPEAARELTGTIIALRLQPLSDRPDLPGDRLSASLGAGRDGFVELHHPLLGRLMVPLRAIQRVEHRCTGRFQLLDARELLMGKPSGGLHASLLKGQLAIEDVPPNGIGFAAEFAGLEPSGPETPPGSPTLKSLRAGRLVTELFVNDQLVGNFNGLSNGWSLPGEFDRLCLKVSSSVLRPGQNSWRIEQRPGDGPRRQYDECRIRNIGWESP